MCVCVCGVQMKMSIIHLVVSWGVCVWCTDEDVNHTGSSQLVCVCGVQMKLSIIHLVVSWGVCVVYR